MSGETGKSSKIAAGVLIIVNFAIMILCTLLFSFALWMIASPSTLSAAIQGFGTPGIRTLLSPETLTVQLGVATAVLSGFFFFIAVLGFYGAVSRSQFLLFMYGALIILLLLLECALTFYFSSSLREKGLQVQDGQWTHALRLAFECCEFNSTIQTAQPNSLPWSCCGTEGYPNNCSSTKMFYKNCKQTIETWLNRYQTAFYASLAVLHILMSSCAFVRRAPSETPPFSPRKRSWQYTSRVTPAHENDDVLMVVLGRGRIGWMEKA